MKVWKKGLAALLAVLMLTSVLPVMAADEVQEVPVTDVALETVECPAVAEDAEEIMDEAILEDAREELPAEEDGADEQATPLSLLPLKEVSLDLDLGDAGIFYSELANVPVSELLKLEDYYGNHIEAEEGDVILWTKGAYSYDLGDEYIQTELDGTMDLTPASGNSYYLYLELIVGKPDQLDISNTRYHIQLDLIQESIFSTAFHLDGYYLPLDGAEDGRTHVEWAGEPAFQDMSDWADEAMYICDLFVRKSAWQEKDIAIGMTLDPKYSALSATFYRGFHTADTIKEEDDITDLIFNQENLATQGGYVLSAAEDWWTEITAVLKRGDKIVSIMPFETRCYADGDSADLDYYLYSPDASAMRVAEVYDYKNFGNDNDYIWGFAYRMTQGLATDKCLAKGTLYHESERVPENFRDYVAKTVASTDKAYYRFSDAAQLEDITDDFFGAGYEADFSKPVYISVFGVAEGNPIECVTALQTINGTLSFSYSDSLSGDQGSAATYSSDESSGKSYVYSMRSAELATDGEYRFSGSVLMNGYSYHVDENGDRVNYQYTDYVDKAVASKSQFYTSMSAANSLPDIQADLFGSGYKADYSKGVYFTIFWKTGAVTTFTVKTIPYVKPAEGEISTEPDTDTYFYVTGADYQNEGRMGTYDAWVMPGNVDGYYFGYAEDNINFGCQTIMLLSGSNGPVADQSEIYPNFFTGRNVTAYAGHEGSAGAKQTTGESPITFESGKAVQYSATAEDNNLVKNYWVTFVTQQSGAKLYANANIDALVDGESESGNPVRQVNLDGAHNFYHDIFFANIGDTQLEGLTVELDATNVELDPYWTIGETDTLAPFTTVEGRDTDNHSVRYGMLPNVGKIRLVPQRDAQGNIIAGEIEGTITISSTNGGSVTFDLTGKAQEAQIVTESLAQGVKYVPYNSVIQTDVMGASNAVSFSYTGTLPTGITLYPNGKLYGVPTARAGDYTFTATATYKSPNDGSIISKNSKEFTLTILDNTAENVDAATDVGYELMDRVDDTVTGSGAQVFRSEGKFNQFMYFYLDGVRLVSGKDYTAEEGSTRITIQAQTLKQNGSGTHTLAAEFRTNQADTNTVKRAAQNYTIPSSGSGSASRPTNGREQNATSTSPKPQEISFKDVTPGTWFYDEVMWAAEKGLMIGVGEELFAPNDLISQTMVATILARLAEVDLANDSSDVTGTGVEPGQWYTTAAVWAWRSGIVGEGTYAALPPLSRGDLAVMLDRYLNYLAIADADAGEAAIFADSDEMTAEQLSAFQRLYAIGILKGVGGDYMAPQRSTTRAEMAIITQRLSTYLADK